MTKRTCDRRGCDRPYRSRGLCKNHYSQAWKKGLIKPIQRRKKRPTCMHLDCLRSATHRFTLPYPITRQEIHCRDHAEHLLGAFIAGITVEDMKEHT